MPFRDLTDVTLVSEDERCFLKQTKVVFWWKFGFWWKLSSDGSCLMMKDIIIKEVMKVVYWWVLSIDESCILMKVVYWWKLFFDESCLLMKVVYWWKLSFDERCLLMKVVQWWKLPIDESYNSQRSDILWRFACGDVPIKMMPNMIKYLKITWCLLVCSVAARNVWEFPLSRLDPLTQVPGVSATHPKSYAKSLQNHDFLAPYHG